jgi:very-short-patch-repair endonuclease
MVPQGDDIRFGNDEVGRDLSAVVGRIKEVIA